MKTNNAYLLMDLYYITFIDYINIARNLAGSSLN